MPFLSNLEFPESGYTFYKNKDFTSPLIIGFCAVGVIISIFINLDDYQFVFWGLLLIIAYFASKWISKTGKKIGFINRHGLIIQNRKFEWDKFETVFENQHYNGGYKDEIEYAVWKFVSANHKYETLTLCSDECNLDLFYRAMREYCPVFISEKESAAVFEKMQVHSAQGAKDPEVLIKQLNQNEYLSTCTMFTIIALVIAMGIYQYYHHVPFLFAHSLAAAIVLNSISIEVHRFRYFRTAYKQHLPHDKAEKLLKQYCMQLNYEGAGNAMIFYLVMGAAIVFIYYIALNA